MSRSLFIIRKEVLCKEGKMKRTGMKGDGVEA
jgi:hypothetical protein